MIEVNADLRIPEEELEFEVGTSSGPGGQNVNRVQTRVTVCFNVAESGSLSARQRDRILDQLASRINKDGVLKVRSEKYRTQHRNRSAARERLAELLAEALYVPPVRHKTRMPRSVREKRVEEKKRRGSIKKDRGRVNAPENE